MYRFLQPSSYLKLFANVTHNRPGTKIPQKRGRYHLKRGYLPRKTGKNVEGIHKAYMKFGLIGHPIEHSLSPALFRAGYDGRYPYDLIVTPDFEEAYRRFADGDYDGINVTAPFKELALKKADIISEECRLTGATNLLRKTPEGIKAHNSDYLGLRLWLQELQDSQRVHAGCKVLIVGMGGAGKAAAAAAWASGMSLTLMNRDMSKAEEMIRRMGGPGGETEMETRPLTDFRECFRKADVIIYNLPVKLPELDALAAEDFLAGNPDGSKQILEANYRNPSFDESLLQRMKEANPKAEYTAGQIWLLLQAVTGYEIFTGERPDLSAMSAQI